MNNNNCGFTVFEDPLGGTYVDGVPGVSTSYVSPDCLPEAVCGKGVHTGNPHCGPGDIPNTPPTAVSEPSVLGLLLVGIVALGLLRRIKR